MDAFISSHITGVPNARIKCRTNYRYLFELVKYLPTSNPEINTDAESWVAGALFTAWDRRAIALGSAAVSLPASALLAASEEAEDFKLLGITVDEFRTLARPIAEQYAAADGINRFSALGLASPTSTTKPASGTVTPPISPATSLAKPLPTSAPSTPTRPKDLGWLTAAASDAAVDREISKRLAQKRDRILAVKLKELYKHECMACGKALLVLILNVATPRRRTLSRLGFRIAAPTNRATLFFFALVTTSSSTVGF